VTQTVLPEAAVPSATPEKRRTIRLLDRPELTVTVTLIALLAYFSFTETASFATVPQLRNIALNAAVLLLVGIGTTFVITSGGFDLSSGSIVVFGGVAAAETLSRMGDGTWAVLVSIAVAVLAGALWGALNGALVGYVGLPPLIITLATLGAALGAAQLVTRGIDSAITSEAARAVGLGRWLGVPHLVWVTGLVTLVAAVVLSHTLFGRWVTALGSSPTAALRAGVPVKALTARVYLLSGALAGLAGALTLFRFGTTSLNGFGTITLEAITIAVLGGSSLFGGRGTVAGTAIAALVPTALLSGLVISGAQPYWQEIAVAAVLVAAVYIDRVRTRRRTTT
jgi:ribose transport system permease protein